MVTPEEIKQFAARCYPRFLKAWLVGEEFFPHEVRCNKEAPSDIGAARREALRLKIESKQSRGFGYSIDWQQKNFRRHGRNPWPQSVYFASADDLLRYLGKRNEFDTFARAVELVRQQFPQLEDWLRKYPKDLIKVAGEIDGLLAVVQSLADNPRPGCFARELPAAVPTKFVEDHQPVLRKWLDLILPSEAVFAHEERFERRYGLKYKGDYLIVRLLDPQLQGELQIPFDDFQLPVDALRTLKPREVSVFVVENEVNLRTLPPLPRTIAFGGLGDAATLLDYLPWIEATPITYWGDLDVEGLEALSTFRARLPQTRSFLMDVATFTSLRDLALPGKGKPLPAPVHLEPPELAAFVRCRDDNLRIEQERIPQPAVLEALAKLQNVHDR